MISKFMFSKFKKGKGETIKLHEQGAGKQEAEEEDKAITRSKSCAQQVSKYRRKSKNLSKFKKKGKQEEEEAFTAMVF